MTGLSPSPGVAVQGRRGGVEPGGALRSIGVVSSGGVTPVSIAVHGSLVYVANAGVGGSNYTGFRLSAFGTLTPLPHSTVTLPDSAQPGDVLFNASGTRLVGTEVNSSLIDSFTVRPDGRLMAAPGSPFKARGIGPFGSEFRPTSPSQLSVTNAHNGTGLGTVSAFTDSVSGELTSAGTSPYADQQTAPCWLAISPDGRHLYAVNTGSGYLYVNESKAGAVGIFAIGGNGSLTEVPGSPAALPAGATLAVASRTQF